MMKSIAILSLAFAALFAGVGCQPNPQVNVASYLVAQRLDTLDSAASKTHLVGSLTGRVVDEYDQPIEGATVVVAQRTGEPHAGKTDQNGTYKILNVPIGNYVPAAVAPGYTEASLQNRFGIRTVVEVMANADSEVPLLQLTKHEPVILPKNLGNFVSLSQTATYTSSTPFPAGASAQVYSLAFDYGNAHIDTLRLYLPRNFANDDGPLLGELELLFMVYPTHVDLWHSVSTALASEGYALLALSPIPARAVDIDAHAEDALVALTLATSGEIEHLLGLDGRIADGKAVALGGSFSSAILNRLLRDSGEQVIGWITVGGIGNAFASAADFYGDRITIPPQYSLVIPALGSPRLYPLAFLRYSPVYVAGAFPPTLIIHTAADRIIPIEQAKELELALRSANIPVDVFYYNDVSHYLQIDENLTDVGKEMFYQVLDFVEKMNEQ